MPGKSSCCITEFCCAVEFFVCFSILDPAVVNEVRSWGMGAGKPDVNAYADLEAAPPFQMLSDRDAIRIFSPLPGKTLEIFLL